MSQSEVALGRGEAGITVYFGERFARSEQFDAVFREGMDLVERTAAYLDGAGRRDARGLKPPVSVTYATESMRLTTRLLELASWLLVQRALRDGEMSQEEAEAKRDQVKLRTFGRPQSIKHFDGLPAGLKGLINESVTLMDRIVHIDECLRARESDEPGPVKANAVNSQLAALQAAFAGRS
ncbi:MAG: DUF1465 family protein [Hyphomicrobiaceae bacterium]|nr:DUF1465 family protein [Hyphomicrobiaceae bacterium]